MKLDHNIPENAGRGKYALVKIRDVVAIPEPEQKTAWGYLDELQRAGVLDYGIGPDADFFVIRLKDKYAAPALAAYAMAAYEHDPEYAMEVLNLAKMAADNPHRRRPD
jgi:hypothetical protein